MKRYWRWLLVLFFLLGVGGVAAAEIIEQDRYVLAEEEVIEEDLYILAAESITIDGVVKGDLVAVSTNVEINGRVEGDVIVGALGVQLYGDVGDDARFLAASVRVNGHVAGDLATTGAGGSSSFDPAPLRVGTRVYDQGVFVEEETEIEGDLLVSSGLLRIEGDIGGRLLGQVAALDLANANIEGGADIAISGDIRVDDESVVSGSGFAYSAPTPLNVRSDLSDPIEYTELELNNTIDPLTILRQIMGQLVIFAVLGWVLLRYLPGPLLRSVAALNSRFTYNLWTSVLVILGLPFVTLAVVILFAFFLSIGPMIAVMGFVAFAYGMLWAFSPLLVGLWLGQRFSNQAYTGLILGTSLLVFLNQIPGLGFFVSTATATIALAGIIGAFFVVVPDEVAEG